MHTVEHGRICALPLLLAMRIIDDEEVCTFTGDSSTDPNGEVFPTIRCIPAARCFGVWLEPYPRENLLILLATDQVPDFAPEVDGEFRSMGSLDDFPIGFLSQEPRR